MEITKGLHNFFIVRQSGMKEKRDEGIKVVNAKHI